MLTRSVFGISDFVFWSMNIRCSIYSPESNARGKNGVFEQLIYLFISLNFRAESSVKYLKNLVFLIIIDEFSRIIAPLKKGQSAAFDPQRQLSMPLRFDARAVPADARMDLTRNNSPKVERMELNGKQ